MREWVGIDNIMWESDYPHIAATIRSRGVLLKTPLSAC